MLIFDDWIVNALGLGLTVFIWVFSAFLITNIVIIFLKKIDSKQNQDGISMSVKHKNSILEHALGAGFAHKDFKNRK